MDVREDPRNVDDRSNFSTSQKIYTNIGKLIFQYYISVWKNVVNAKK